MAIIRFGGSRSRPYALKRGLIVSHWRGLLRVQSWPQHQRRRPSLYLQSIRDQFRRVVKAVKNVHPREQVPTLDAIERFNKLHQGQKSDATTRFRDWEMMRLTGHLWYIVEPDGTKVFPRSFREVQREQADALDDTVGAILMRHPDIWR